MLNSLQSRLLLDALQKAVLAGNIAPIVPQDLELEAHNTLWNEQTETELTMLRLIPKIPATQVIHEFSRVTSFGDERISPFFGENTLPGETRPEFDRKTVNIKLAGGFSRVYLLAGLEQTVNALGTQGAVQITDRALQLSTMRKINRQLYIADTSKTRLGTAGLRWKGLFQQIREGTDGTDGTDAVNGSHVIDLQGQPLSPAFIAEYVSKTIEAFGYPNIFIAAPAARNSIERQFDSSNRSMLSVVQPLVIGQIVMGMQTQNGIVRFLTDNILSDKYMHPNYAAPAEGAPSTTPTVSAPSASTTTGSKFLAADAGTYFYVVTEVVNEAEGAGVRAPSGSSTVTVAAGDGVAMSITPGNALADSFRIYRGTGSGAITSAKLIAEIANSGGGGAVSFTDLNEERPGTSYALLVPIRGAVADSVMSKPLGEVAKAAPQFAGTSPAPSADTVALACLGPQMGVMQVAAILPAISQPLIYSACAPEVRNALQSWVFKNVGVLAS